MKRTTRLVLSVAAGCLAMGLALAYGSSVRAEAEQARQELLAAYGGDLVTVCVASSAIDAGEELDESRSGSRACCLPVRRPQSRR